jgi:transcriptional regulator with XRE-family HTH domain
MTPETFKAIRERAGLSRKELAVKLRIKDHHSIYRYEAGIRTPSGAITLLMEMLDAGKL